MGVVQLSIASGYRMRRILLGVDVRKCKWLYFSHKLNSQKYDFFAINLFITIINPKSINIVLKLKYLSNRKYKNVRIYQQFHKFNEEKRK